MYIGLLEIDERKKTGCYFSQFFVTVHKDFSDIRIEKFFENISRL